MQSYHNMYMSKFLAFICHSNSLGLLPSPTFLEDHIHTFLRCYSYSDIRLNKLPSISFCFRRGAHPLLNGSKSIGVFYIYILTRSLSRLDHNLTITCFGGLFCINIATSPATSLGFHDSDRDENQRARVCC